MVNDSVSDRVRYANEVYDPDEIFRDGELPFGETLGYRALQVYERFEELARSATDFSEFRDYVIRKGNSYLVKIGRILDKIASTTAQRVREELIRGLEGILRLGLGENFNLVSIPEFGKHEVVIEAQCRGLESEFFPLVRISKSRELRSTMR